MNKLILLGIIVLYIPLSFGAIYYEDDFDTDKNWSADGVLWTSGWNLDLGNSRFYTTTNNGDSNSFDIGYNLSTEKFTIMIRQAKKNANLFLSAGIARNDDEVMGLMVDVGGTYLGVANSIGLFYYDGTLYDWLACAAGVDTTTLNNYTLQKFQNGTIEFYVNDGYKCSLQNTEFNFTANRVDVEANNDGGEIGYIKIDDVIYYSEISDIFVDNESLNFTSDGGQICGWNGSEYSLCGPTEDETPTFRFNTYGEAFCKIWNDSLNWSILDSMGIPNCATTGSTNHVCSFPYALNELTTTIYVSCKNAGYEMNDFTVNPANQFNITIAKYGSAVDSIMTGINTSSIWPGATIYNNQQVYVRTANNDQALAIFDRVAVYGNQRWAFNYVSVNDTAIGTFYNLSPVFYFLEMMNLTNSEITRNVGELINSTKS